MGSGRGRYIGQPLDAGNPLRRDTFFVPAYSWFVMRLVLDNRECVHDVATRSLSLSLFYATAGLWAFHCHLSWHMAAGLLMQINALPSAVARWPEFPREVIEQCGGTPAPRRR